MRSRRSFAHQVRRMQRRGGFGWLRAWVTMVMLAVAGQGLVAGLLTPSGPLYLHLHRTAPSTLVASSLGAMAGWEDARRVHDIGQTQHLRPLSAGRPHLHGGLERHRHAIGDASVVGMDDGSDEATGAAWSLAALAPGLPPGDLRFCAVDAERDWPLLGSIRFASRWPPLLERPPKA